MKYIVVYVSGKAEVYIAEESTDESYTTVAEVTSAHKALEMVEVLNGATDATG